jgi:hypothetical protein
MNTLILNRDSFELPGDGWYQVAPLGEFPHRPSGVIQVVDKDACAAMASAFTEQAKKANFAGLLIDFDHFSLDDKLKSEAAGWIVGLENRGPRAEGGDPKPEERERATGAGLWAKIRWSDLGEEVVKGGRYRFLSPVWSQRDCVDLGDGRLRPVRLLNAAVTNDPNLKGMVPLSNRGRVSGVACRGGEPTPPSAPLQGGDLAIANTGGAGDEQRYEWTLGDSPDGRHCPSCVALAGQVHTMREWEEAGLGPGGDGLYCQGNCHCSLEKTDDPVTGEIEGAPGRKADTSSEDDVISNVGWTDEARAASLAVRQAKAAARRAAREAAGSDSGGGSNGDDMTQREYEFERLTWELDNYRGLAESAFNQEYGYFPTTPDEIAEGEDLAGVPDEYRTHGEMTPAELAEQLLDAEYGSEDGEEPGRADERESAEGENLSVMSPEAVKNLTSQVREKLRSGERLDPGEENFLRELTDAGYAGESDGDPIFQWQERQAMARFEADGTIANVGWTDEARAASLAVRRAKAAARKAGEDPPGNGWTRDVPDPEGDKAGPALGRGRWPYPDLPDFWPGGTPDLPIFWPGGTPDFDEGFGRPVWPPPWPIPPEPDPEPEPEPKPEPVPVPEMHPPFGHFPDLGNHPTIWGPKDSVEADKGRRRDLLRRRRG